MRTIMLALLCLMCAGCSTVELTVNVPEKIAVPKHHKHQVKEKTNGNY